MSASRERKKRMSEEQAPAVQQRKPEKKKLSEGLLLLGVVVLILAIVFGSMAGYNAYWRHATVLTVGEHKVSTSELNYFLNSTVSQLVNTYSSYLSIIGLDPSVSLKDQNVPNSDENAEPQTWAAYLADSAKTMAVNYYTVLDDAEKNGYALTQEQLDKIEGQITTLSAYAKIYGYTADKYVENMFGSGCDVDGYREFLKLSYIYSDYISSQEYTADEISARYAQDPTEFDFVSYKLYTVRASAYVEKNEDGTTGEITDDARTEAKKAAEAMAKDFDESNESVTDGAELSKTNVTNRINEDAANWLFGSSVKAGDIKLFEGEDVYYVVKFLSRTDNDYKTVNFLQIYLKNDSTDDSSSSSDSTTKTSAQKLSEIKAELEKDASEEKFTSLASTYSDNTTTTYTQAVHQSVSNQEVYAWLFDGKPAENEYKIFETSEGTYIVFFKGYDDTCKNLLVSNALRSEWLENLTKDAPYDYDAAKAEHCHLDYAINSAYNLNSNSSAS